MVSNKLSFTIHFDTINEDPVLYISTSVCVLRTPNAVRNSHFQRFLCKKVRKTRNLQQNFAKNTFFLVCTRTLVDSFISQKELFSLKTRFYLLSC